MDTDKEQYRVAFGAGVISRLRLEGVDAVDFVKRAYESPSPDMQKVAEATHAALLAELEKTASVQDVLGISELACVRYAQKLAAVEEALSNAQGVADEALTQGQGAVRGLAQRADKALVDGKIMAHNAKQQVGSAADSARQELSNALGVVMDTGSNIYNNLTHTSGTEKAKRLVNAVTGHNMFDESNPIEQMINNATRRGTIDHIKHTINANLGTELETEGLLPRLQRNLLG